MAAGCRDIDGPVAGAGDVRLPAFLYALERAAVAGRDVMGAAGLADEFLELVVEAPGTEVAFFLRHPLLKPKMRFDDELGH